MIEVYCNKHRSVSLAVDTNQTGIVVDPCPACLDTVRDEGYEEGHSQGYDEGYDAGRAESDNT